MRQLSPLEKQRGEQLAQFLAAGQNLCADASGFVPEDGSSRDQTLRRLLDEYEEIERLLGLCQQVHSLHVKRPPLSQSPERIAYERHQATLLTRVNGALQKFVVRPRLEAHEQGLASVWSSVQPLSPAMVQAIRAFKSDPRPIGPHSAVHVILDMTVAGTLNRIRRCENPNCQKWIMVTSTKRVTCSDDCRFAKYQLQKGSRANDMRRSRKLHKDHPQLKKQKGRSQ